MFHYRDAQNSARTLRIAHGNPLFAFLFALSLLALGGFPLPLALATSSALQLVVPLDGEPFEGKLHTIDEHGLTFVGQTKVTLPLDQFVRWGNPVEPRPHTFLVLADGGRLVAAADWVGGAPVRLDGDTIVLQSALLSEVRLPRSVVAGVVFAQHKLLQDRLRLAELTGSTATGTDVLWLTNGDRLDGNLSELGGGTLAMDTTAGTAKLPLSRVEAVVLAAARKGSQSSQNPATPQKAKLAAALRDGSLLYVDALRATEQELVLELASCPPWSGGSVDDLIALQSLGGRFVYLSDLNPVDYRHVPYFTIHWPYQRDRNALGEMLVVNGKQYLKGIGMHSASRLTYSLNAEYRRFDAAVAIDDSAKRRGSVVFGVYLLRDGQWREAYRSGTIRGGNSPQPVSVDLSGAAGLTLTVDYADRGDELDRAVWLDARFIKKN